MDSIPTVKPRAVVIDASFLVTLCARESDKFAQASAQMQSYAEDGFELFAPGIIVAETLFALCRKEQSGDLTAPDHNSAVLSLAAYMQAILPPPGSDRSLMIRANQIRGISGCSRSADSLYIALAEELVQ